MDQQSFVNLLATASKYAASDIHLHPGSPPAFRIKGDLVNIKSAALTDADMLLVMRLMITDPAKQALISQMKDFDGSFEISGLCRFRYNIFRHRGKFGAILRLIPANVPSLEGLKFPPVLKTIALSARGLVLVTGATGSGKSSTLAAMIDHINSNTGSHILTIEDPVEFVHPPKKSRLTQREIGPDTENFAGALRSALRQDPDVILVGEMRDAETIDIALKAAETGHMVFSTVHTQDASKTIGRLISVFKPEEQKMVRQRLADNLKATISQRLVKRVDGKGLVAAQEIMVSNMSIAECIADPAKTGEINEYIMKSREITGGQTFDQHLVELYQSGVISLEAALDSATNPSDFQRNLTYGGNQSQGKSDQNASKPVRGNVPAEPTVTLDFGTPVEEKKEKSTPAESPAQTQTKSAA